MSMMHEVMRHKNLGGQIFTNLRVLYRLPKNGSGHAMWMCRCLCGTMKICSYGNLKTGKNKSCGKPIEHKRLLNKNKSPSDLRLELIKKAHARVARSVDNDYSYDEPQELE